MNAENLEDMIDGLEHVISRHFHINDYGDWVMNDGKDLDAFLRDALTELVIQKAVQEGSGFGDETDPKKWDMDRLS